MINSKKSTVEIIVKENKDQSEMAQQADLKSKYYFVFFYFCFFKKT